jgi:segregation and condensation protein B
MSQELQPNIKAKVEAVLFLTDKPMRAQAIARIVNADVQVVRQLILELIHDYEERAGALEIAQENGYIIEVKSEYASLMEEFFPIEMSAALLRTLSAIAIKQPIMQSEIIRVRGAGAYDHIKELMNRQLINKKEEGGRSPILTTTKKFQEYFRLSSDANSLRKFLKKQAQPEDPADGQLALPLSDEEKAKQEQMEAVLGQLLEVAAEPGGDDEPPPALEPPDSLPLIVLASSQEEVSLSALESSESSPLVVLSSSDEQEPPEPPPLMVLPPSQEAEPPVAQVSDAPPLVVLPPEPASNGESN